MRKTILAGILVLALGPLSAHALNISLDPSAVGPITAGDTISVNLVASDLGENEVITAFDARTAYDNGLLTLDSTSYSTALGDPACDILDFAPPCDAAQALFDSTNIEGPGFADPNLFSLLTDLTGLLALQGAGWDGVLATMSFTANADAASTSFALEWSGVNDVKCNNARNPSDLDYVCFPDDSSSVPEPTTLALLGLGLLGVGYTRRRQTASS